MLMEVIPGTHAALRSGSSECGIVSEVIGYHPFVANEPLQKQRLICNDPGDLAEIHVFRQDRFSLTNRVFTHDSYTFVIGVDW